MKRLLYRTLLASVVKRFVNRLLSVRHIQIAINAKCIPTKSRHFKIRIIWVSFVHILSLFRSLSLFHSIIFILYIKNAIFYWIHEKCTIKCALNYLKIWRRRRRRAERMVTTSFANTIVMCKRMNFKREL